MKKALVASAVLIASLAACSSNTKAPVIDPRETVYPGPVLKLKNYDGPEAMDEGQVLTAKRNCILNKMIPMEHEVSVRTEYGKTPVTVRVSCVAPLP
jgi:hypothetical protein